MTLPSAGHTLEEVRESPLPSYDLSGALCPALVLQGREETQAQIDKVCLLLGASKCTNQIAYPPRSHMKWHTNSNVIGKRTYYTFTAHVGAFIYKNYDTGETITDMDNVGWTVREFLVQKDKPLWHCVWSDGIRFSFGFNTIYEG
jgi:hypothetical protein